MHIGDLSACGACQLRSKPDGSDGKSRPTTFVPARSNCAYSRGSPDAVTFEEFIRKKFVGAKTFSLEGSREPDSPARSRHRKSRRTRCGKKSFGHSGGNRGRLNVLANIIGKSARQIFREFADTGWKSSPGRGDVKYHLGHSSEWTTAGGKKIQLALCFNPSHLELVNGVALGAPRQPAVAGLVQEDRETEDSRSLQWYC